MHKGRLEAFSDGVFAIIITIMVLELHAPRGAELSALRPLLPSFLAYALSFVYLGIYWNNHHHLLQAAKHVGGGVLWANLHLLFWLSLIPFATAWSGQNPWERVPTAAYGGVLLMAGAAYWILAHALMDRHGRDSVLARALGRDAKGLVSIAAYALSVAAAFLDPRLSYAGHVGVALLWPVPDDRIEKAVAAER